jgi:hypothetical protein
MVIRKMAAKNNILSGPIDTSGDQMVQKSYAQDHLNTRLDQYSAPRCIFLNLTLYGRFSALKTHCAN